MMRYAALVALVGLATACKGDTDCDPEADSDCDTGSCENSIDEVFPSDGETAAYYRTAVEVELDDEETDATVSLEGPDGDVTGTSTVHGELIIFVPDAPLAPATSYTVTVNYSCGSPTTTFTTSEVGAAAAEADIEGKTYSLDLSTGRFVEPAGIGSILGDFIDQEVLISVQSVSATEINMIGAIGDGGNPPAQGECEPTIGFPIASFTGNPFFQIGPETTVLSVSGFDITIQDLEISGAFGPDGSYFAGAVLAGTIDTRPLVPLLNADNECGDGEPRCCDTDVDPGCNPDDDVANCCDEDAICDLAGQIGVACITCSNDNEDFCLDLYVDSMQAEVVTGVTIDPQHGPEDGATTNDSTNFCDNAGCATDAACIGDNE